MQVISLTYSFLVFHCFIRLLYMVVLLAIYQTWCFASMKVDSCHVRFRMSCSSLIPQVLLHYNCSILLPKGRTTAHKRASSKLVLPFSRALDETALNLECDTATWGMGL